MSKSQSLQRRRRNRWGISRFTSPATKDEVRLLGVFFVARRRGGLSSAKPRVVMLAHEFFFCFGFGQIKPMLHRIIFGSIEASPRLFRGSAAKSAIHVARDLPRGSAREVGRRQRAASEQLPFSRGGRGHARLELALASLRTFGFVARGFDLSQRTRESAHLAVNVLFADSPERVERVFSRHDVVDDSAAPLEKPITVTLFFLNLAAIGASAAGAPVRRSGRSASNRRAHPP
jgi:hypothetical protein